jgi:hypothetical protein
MPSAIGRFREGDPLGATRLNELVDAVNGLKDIRVAGGLTSRKGPGGIMLGVSFPTVPSPARTTAGGITARAGSTLGQGNVVLEVREDDEVSDGAEVVCYSNFAIAVAHPANLMVAWDGSAYWLIGADCPEE